MRNDLSSRCCFVCLFAAGLDERLLVACSDVSLTKHFLGDGATKKVRPCSLLQWTRHRNIVFCKSDTKLPKLSKAITSLLVDILRPTPSTVASATLVSSPALRKLADCIARHTAPSADVRALFAHFPRASKLEIAVRLSSTAAPTACRSCVLSNVRALFVGEAPRYVFVSLPIACDVRR